MGIKILNFTAISNPKEKSRIRAPKTVILKNLFLNNFNFGALYLTIPGYLSPKVVFRWIKMFS